MNKTPGELLWVKLRGAGLAIVRLEGSKAMFKDVQHWSQSIGVIDTDTEQIEQIVDECDLRQNLEIQDRCKWFVLEEICETTTTQQYVYAGMSGEDVRISTLFCWESFVSQIRPRTLVGKSLRLGLIDELSLVSSRSFKI
mgnify:CR=1 FL=1